MSKQSKATSIPRQVKTEVWFRDGKRCIICRQFVPIQFANSHVVKRSQGGLGIKENIVTHCLECHQKYDGMDNFTVKRTYEYIEKIYEGWKRERVVYNKYGKNRY